MAFKISSLKTDKLKEEEGGWVTFGADLMVKIARMDNINYLSCLRKLSKGHISQIRLNDDPKTIDLIESFRRKAMARHILLDWKNMEDDEGKTIQYSYEKALELFESIPEFYRGVIELSSDATNFKVEERSESLGNLLSSSNGNSP